MLRALTDETAPLPAGADTAAEGLSGYTILIKGSNGTRLYQLPDLL